MKKYTKAVLLSTALALSVSVLPSANVAQAATLPNIDYSKIQVTGVPNNAATVLMPIIEKVGKGTGSLAASELKSSFNASVSSIVKNIKSDFSLNTNSVAQNIFNPLTSENETNQNAATVSYSIDQSYMKALFNGDTSFSQGTITFQTRYFKTKKGSDIYFNITGMPSGLYSLITKYTDSSNKLKLNSWYKYSTATIANMQSSSVLTPVKSSDYQYQLYASKLLFSNLTLKQDFGVEKLAMGDARHVKLGLTSQGVVNFVRAVQALNNTSQNSTVAAQVQSELLSALSNPEMQNIITGTTVDIWVGVNDARIYKVLVSGKGITLPLRSYSYGTTTPATNDKLLINLDLSSEAQTVNAVPKIAPPSVFIDLNKLLDTSMSAARERGTTAGIAASIANTRAQAELYYSTTGNNTYAGVCISSANGLKQIITGIKTNFKGTVVNCKSTATAFVISAKVKAGQYVCADSTGNFQTTNKTDRALGKTYTCK
jgi:hypothetical protein